MEPHLSQYKIFYEVARCGNISRAARELYISQPAISKAVNKLEEGLSALPLRPLMTASANSGASAIFISVICGSASATRSANMFFFLI